MTPLERAIVDAVGKAVQAGHSLRSIYLRPEEIDELGAPDAIGGLPVKRISGKGRPTLYTRRGVAIAIRLPRPPAPPAQLSPGEQQILVSLLRGWPIGTDVKLERRLQRAGLVDHKTVHRSFKGRTFDIGEPRLTGRGEEAAHTLWAGLSRDERTAMHEAALRSGLDFPATTPAERGSNG